MSETYTPSLIQYFGSTENDQDQVEPSTDITESKTVVNNQSNDNKSEPEVCRIFAETPPKPKDPTAAFFDLIGTTHTNSANGIMSDLGLPSTSSDDGYSALATIDTESDRRRDAWIPSERTRQVLIACATATPGTYLPDREVLTMPGVLMEEEMGDAVAEAVALCLGEAEAAQRRALSASDVPQDDRGVRELVRAGAYRAAANLTARLLSAYGQGPGRIGHATRHSPRSLQLWFSRLALLVKSGMADAAKAEAEAFRQLDGPDIYYQFYPDMYNGRTGSIASFSFRLLLAELPMHYGKHKEALTRLFNVLATVRQILRNLDSGLREDGSPTEITAADRQDSLRLWEGREARTMHSLVNCGLALKDYSLAMDIMGQLCNRDGAPKDALLSALGRLHLQLGDISGAEGCFNESAELRHTGHPGIRELVDRGLLAIAQGSFDEGYVAFQQASTIEPSNIMILNNMGVCLLYGGHLKEAIAVLESAITSNPVHALQESLLLNLCTLYDMESSKGRMKKFALLRQISRYQADTPTTILEKLYG